MSATRKLFNADYKFHLLLSFVMRLMLIAYGVYHDAYSTVPYTDIDYRVFTDASRHVLNNRSPYDRHTYRYSPILAIILTPNILIHGVFGKVLFSLMDVIVALLIRSIVASNVRELKLEPDQTFYKSICGETTQVNLEKRKDSNTSRQRKRSKQNLNKKIKTNGYCGNNSSPKSPIDSIANASMLVWLYNPMTIAISTRGNCDSLSGFLVLLTLYFLQCKKQPFVAGLVHGFSIHFRLYPIAYSLTYFMFLSKFSFYKADAGAEANSKKSKQIKDKENLIRKLDHNNSSVVPTDSKGERKTIFKAQYLLYLVPNVKQVQLILGCLMSLACLTGVFYHMYGYRFLFETYLYHLTRVDTRHNFSLYFYLQYLTAWVRNIGLWQKVLMALPQVVLLAVFSVRYGLNRFTLNFAVLLQTIVLVIYNRVLTSQYFVWIMAILPLCVWQMRIANRTAMLLIGIWFAAQAAWLLPAFLLEFQGQNTFLFIWIQSISFFCANIAILGRFIMHFMPDERKKNV